MNESSNGEECRYSWDLDSFVPGFLLSCCWSICVHSNTQMQKSGKQQTNNKQTTNNRHKTNKQKQGRPRIIRHMSGCEVDVRRGRCPHSSMFQCLPCGSAALQLSYCASRNTTTGRPTNTRNTTQGGLQTRLLRNKVPQSAGVNTGVPSKITFFLDYSDRTLMLYVV